MKNVLTISICVFVVITFVIASISFYNELFKKKYIFEDLKVIGNLLYADSKIVAMFNKVENEEAFKLVKDIAVYRKTDEPQEFSLAISLSYDDKISWNEKYIEYDGITYLADKNALSKLNEYCESVIAEHNDTTPKKPYELSAEDISAVKLTCYFCENKYEYDISPEDFEVFAEKVNEITMFQRYNDFQILYGGGSYVFDVELKNGEAFEVNVSDGLENTEHVHINDKTYVSDADGLMEFIRAYAVID